ncbi:MAG TPA: hypothetical protein VJL37_11230 [Flavobacterium sp.]|nr:hypothetical protein [Flavobacterium sp.]
MKKYLYQILLLVITITSFAQNNPKKTVEDNLTNHKTIEQNPDALYLLDSVSVHKKVFSKISSSDIEKVEIINDKAFTEKFGKQAEKGIVVITSKERTKKYINGLRFFYAKKPSLNIHQEKVELSGIVIDCEGPIPGANVENLNTKERVQSNFDGSFKITCRVFDIISFNFMGMIEKKMVVGKSNSNLLIKLEPDPNVREVENLKVAKPVIYLYPEKEEDINLKINFKGQLATTYPKYEDSWNVKAYPDGKIWDTKTKRFYTSLFWDGDIRFEPEHYQYKEGFVVEKKNLIGFLTEKLEHIGLNTYETNDFIQYWLPILEQNEFNFIHFTLNEKYNEISENIVKPSPKTSIRVMMEFYKTDKHFEIKEQEIQKTKRNGFTLIEWGGCDVSKMVSKNTL